MTSTEQFLRIQYTNYRGESAIRHVSPISIWWGSTEWHPEPQWLLKAYDVDKQATRDFALRDCNFQVKVVPYTVLLMLPDDMRGAEKGDPWYELAEPE